MFKAELCDHVVLYSIVVPRFRKKYKLRPYELRALCFLYRCHKQSTPVTYSLYYAFLFKKGNFNLTKIIRESLPAKGLIQTELHRSRHGQPTKIHYLTPRGLEMMQELERLLTDAANNVSGWCPVPRVAAVKKARRR